MAKDCTACAARRRRRENRPPQETPDVAAGAARLVRGLGKRAQLDVDALPLLVELAELVESELAAAATSCATSGAWSWGDVGRRLGMTRQGARQRFDVRGKASGTAVDDYAGERQEVVSAGTEGTGRVA